MGCIPAIPPAELADVTTAVTGQIKSLNSELQETIGSGRMGLRRRAGAGRDRAPAWLATRIEAWASCETHPASPQPSRPCISRPTARRAACWLIIAFFGTTRFMRSSVRPVPPFVNLRTPGKTGGIGRGSAASSRAASGDGPASQPMTLRLMPMTMPGGGLNWLRHQASRPRGRGRGR